MANDTIIMSGCLICILLLNTMVFLYNQEPIQQYEFNYTEVSVNQFETGINESGITDSSSGLRAIFSIFSFFGNIVRLLFGWFSNFPFTVNLIIKLGTYIFAIPLFITILRMIRGN